MGPVESLAGTGPGFAVVDVETTGFAPERERIVEVAVVVLDADGRETDAFCTLLDPGRDPGPTHVHGIEAAMLAGAPTFAEVRPFVADRCSGRVLVGHNVDRFDLAFLRAECRRAGGDAAVPGRLPTLDTLPVAQAHLPLPGKARLVDCCDHFGLVWADHHSALGDARATAALLAALRAVLGDELLGTSRLLAEAAGLRWPGAAAARPAAHGRLGAAVR